MRLVKQSTNSDITKVAASYTWSGDYQSVARKLELGVAVSATDQQLLQIDIPTGDRLDLFDDNDNPAFSGRIFFREKSLKGNTLKVIAYDDLIYVAKSKLSKNFKGITAEQITETVCTELGVTVGTLAQTGINQNLIMIDKTGYEIIMAAYTSASKQNGKKYIPMIMDGKLQVIEKGQIMANFVLDSKKNFVDSIYTESIESMVNQVIITDENGNRIGYVNDQSLIDSFGMIQAIYQQESDKDPVAMASAKMSGIERKASIKDALGNMNCITGFAVAVKDAYTGLTGLFYIDQDTHTFANGQHLMSLELNFVNMMDEQDGGT